MSGRIVMKAGFRILKVEAGNAERGDIGVDGLRAADEAQQNIRGYVVAERNGQAQKLAQGDINSGIRILILEKTVDVGQDAVLRKEAHGLIERKRALFDLMKNGESEREFED